MRRTIVIACSAILFIAAAALPARAQGISLVRDAEIERYIKVWSEPIFRAAEIEQGAVKIHLVNDDSVNAFVANGQRIFVFTGLLTAAKDPLEVIGVLAHETGHITGGHLSRFRDGLQGASTISIISLILGAAAIAAGAGDAGAAILGSSGEFATRSFLTYSRTQEASADQAGLQFLTASGQSAHGLINFFEYLGDQEALLTTNQDPYVRSHPLTQDRIARLRESAQQSPFWMRPARPEYTEMLKRTQAKLHGFLTYPPRVLRMYPVEDTSPYARYARAVAYHRQALTDQAMEELDALLADAPRDPYYWELKGQILFESGRMAEAIEPYRTAVRMAPYEPLIRVALAQSILSTEDPETVEEAIGNLRAANRMEPNNGFAWHQLALAYNLKGDEARAALASAERFAIAGRAPEAARQARLATKELEPDTPEWYRAQDLYMIARNAIEDDYRRRGKKPPPDPDDPEKGDPDNDDTPEQTGEQG
ncbi:MAG: M48 family metalloprotease [Alphaproteobacteria bacterium]